MYANRRHPSARCDDQRSVLSDTAVLGTPLYGSALFLTANAVAYWLAFRNSPPPEEIRRSPPAQHG
jgi:hypothetical protein